MKDLKKHLIFVAFLLILFVISKLLSQGQLQNNETNTLVLQQIQNLCGEFQNLYNLSPVLLTTVFSLSFFIVTILYIPFTGRFFIVSSDGLGLHSTQMSLQSSQGLVAPIFDETPNTYNVTTNVHGYGGGAFFVKDNIIYFNDSISNQVYKKNVGHPSIIQVTSATGFCYADFNVDKFHKYLYCLRLDTNKNIKFPITQIVRIEIQTGKQEILFTGADFYSNIRISRDGTKLLFLQWNYPNMPWDENELWTADIEPNFQVTNLKKIFHKNGVSLYQPEWVNSLIYSAVNINNYSEICEINENHATSLFSYPADFSRPLWLAGSRTFSFISEHEIIANCCENGIWKTFLIDIQTHKQSIIKNNLTCFYNMAADSSRVAFIAGHSLLPLSVLFSFNQNKEKINILRTSMDKTLHEDYISTPQLLEFLSSACHNEKKVYALYYPPKNPKYPSSHNKNPPPLHH